MRLALLQFHTTADKADNLRRAAAQIKRAADRGAEVVMLPEMFCCPYDNRCFPDYCEEKGGLIWQTLSNAARKNHVWLVGGSMPEWDDGRIYNTSFVFDPEGRQAARHRKVHLFDINVEGGQSFRESDVLSAGTDCTVFDTPFGRIGLCICFDLRFPALFQEMAERGARCILIPAAFNCTTGPLHWELLFRARAVDYELFTAGCSPSRDVRADYVAYGHSLVISPWGKVLADAGTEEGMIEVNLDLDEADRMRSQIPVIPLV